MKSPALLAAVIGVLALASANASAGTDSASLRVSLRIAAPCEVSTVAAAQGAGGVTVRCESASTPYRLEPAAAEAGPQNAQALANDGYTRMTLTF